MSTVKQPLGDRRRETIPVVRLQMIREGDIPYSRKPVGNSSVAAEIFQSYLAGADREYFIVLLLDNKHRINAINVVSIGSLTTAIVHPREVFKPAVMANAAAVILGHCHPSGDPAPSSEDFQLTKRLVEAGELMGIPVLDHIVVGQGQHVSFADRGLMSKALEARERK